MSLVTDCDGCAEPVELQKATRHVSVETGSTKYFHPWCWKAGTHRLVPRKLPGGPIKLFPIKVTQETKVVGGFLHYEVIIDQRAWSILLEQILRAEDKAKPNERRNP
jgi:hypothetical protein